MILPLFLHSILPSDTDETDDQMATSVVVAEPKAKIKKPNLSRVIIFNDDYTPMEFVVYILQTLFGFGKEKATQIMLAVHTQGKGVCGIFTKEVAETRSMQINNLAQENEHPLLSEIEPIEED